MGIQKKQAAEIFKSQFDLVATEMRKKEGTSVRLPFFATFKVSKYRLRKMLDYLKTKTNERSNL